MSAEKLQDGNEGSKHLKKDTFCSIQSEQQVCTSVIHCMLSVGCVQNVLFPGARQHFASMVVESNP